VKIVFVIPSLEIGGAEIAMVDLVNKLSENKNFSITLVSMSTRCPLETKLSKNIVLKKGLNYFSIKNW